VRFHVKVVNAGFVWSLSIIFFGFPAFSFAPSIANFGWSLGLKLVGISNELCLPSAAACVFGSDSQGRQHLWFFICLFVSWWVVASSVLWFVAKYVVTKPRLCLTSAMGRFLPVVTVREFYGSATC
jgi:hypothetical protein